MRASLLVRIAVTLVLAAGSTLVAGAAYAEDPPPADDEVVFDPARYAKPSGETFVGKFPARGGWSPNRHGVNLGEYPDKFSPLRWTLSEPYTIMSTGQWAVDVKWKSLFPLGDTERATGGMSAQDVHGGYFRCSNTGSPSAANLYAYSTASVQSNRGETVPVFREGVFTLVAGAGCTGKFLHEVLAAPLSYGGAADGYVMEWVANRNKKYDDDDGSMICTVDPNHPECRDRDGTDFEVVCRNAPSASWLSFDWLPAWIGHYANCLFKPVNGWPAQRVSDGLAGTSVGALTTAVGSIGGSFSSSESCGVVAAGEWKGQAIAFNTCSWSGWGTGKALLGAAAIVLALIGGIRLLARNVMGPGSAPTGGDDE